MSFTVIMATVRYETQTNAQQGMTRISRQEHPQEHYGFYTYHMHENGQMNDDYT